MNRKQLAIVVVLGVVVGALALMVLRRNQAAYQSSSQTLGRLLLPDFPLNEVATIVFRKGTNELGLVKSADTWTVRERHGYPANFKEIGDLLRKFWELKAVQTEQVGESLLPRLELVQPGQGTGSGTLVEFKDKQGQPLRSLLLGKMHMRRSDTPSPMGGSEGYPDGRYLLVINGPKDVAVVSETFSEVEPQPDRWLNKDFFKVEKLKSVSVTHPDATNSWTLARETENGEMKMAGLAEGEQQDTGKSSSVGNALSYPSFIDVLAPDANPEDTGLDKPIVAKLETFDGFHYTVRIGKPSSEENYPVTVETSASFPSERTSNPDEQPEDKERLDQEFKDQIAKLDEKLKREEPFKKWIYTVSKWTVDPLLKLRKDFLAEKTATPAEADTPKEEPAVVLPNPLVPPGEPAHDHDHP